MMRIFAWVLFVLLGLSALFTIMSIPTALAAGFIAGVFQVLSALVQLLSLYVMYYGVNSF